MQILRDLLTSAGYEIVEAENGEEALAAVAKRRPDLILMDIQLPIIDGYEATRRIKADPGAAIDTDHRSDVPCIETAVKRRRARRVAMTSWPSPIARVNCWRRSASTSAQIRNSSMRAAAHRDLASWRARSSGYNAAINGATCRGENRNRGGSNVRHG